MVMTARPVAPRLLAHREISPTGCWLWTGAFIVSRGGAKYGVISKDGRQVLVHRAAFEEWVGPISDEIDHRCEVTLCFNPEHLRDVTHVVNQEWATKEFCVRGHNLAETRRVPAKGRAPVCYPCVLERNRQWRRKKVAA